MTAFQVIGIAICVILLLQAVRARRGGRLGPQGAVTWMLLTVAGMLALVVPDVTTEIAHLLGVSRGADLLLYCGVLGALFTTLRLHTRLRRLESDLTSLVRELALHGSPPPTRGAVESRS